MCQAFARRIDKMEAARTRNAFRVPPTRRLNERILLRIHEGSRKNQKTAWRAFALAATLLLTVAVSLHIGSETGNASSAQLALAAATIAGDEAARMRSHRSLGMPASSASCYRISAAPCSSRVSQVRYVTSARLKDSALGWHIAYDTAAGKVTLLLIPGQHSGPDTQTVQVEGMQVRVQRAGQGYYAADPLTICPGLRAADHDMKTKVRWRKLIRYWACARPAHQALIPAEARPHPRLCPYRTARTPQRLK